MTKSSAAQKTILICIVCSLVVEHVHCLCNYLTEGCPKELQDSPSGNVICNINCIRLDNETCEIFPQVLKHETEDRAKVVFQALVHEETQSIYFNFSILDKRWQRLKMKLYRNEHPIIHECVEYNLLDGANATATTSLLLELPGAFPSLEGKSFHIDYELIENHLSDIGRLLFNVPKFKKFFNAPLQGSEIFSYVDMTNPQVLYLKVQPLASKLNVPAYNVEVWRQRGDFTRQMEIRYFYKSDVKDEQILYPYHTYGSKGLYYFSVYPEHPICEQQNCIKSLTPVVLIGSGNNSLVIGIVCASLIIPILLYIFYMWNKRCKIRTYWAQSPYETCGTSIAPSRELVLTNNRDQLSTPHKI